MDCTETRDELPPPPPKDSTLQTFILFLPFLPPLPAVAGQGLAVHNQKGQPHFLFTPNQPMPDPGQFVCLTLGVLEVVSPKRPNLVLATHIPNCETDVLVFYCLHVEPFGKNKQWLLGLKYQACKQYPVGLFLFPVGIVLFLLFLFPSHGHDPNTGKKAKVSSDLLFLDLVA